MSEKRTRISNIKPRITVQIAVAENGAAMISPDWHGEPGLKVFEADVDENNIGWMKNLLWDVLEAIRSSEDSRYSRERIEIRIVHGDKFEHSSLDLKKDCKICNETLASFVGT